MLLRCFTDYTKFALAVIELTPLPKRVYNERDEAKSEQGEEKGTRRTPTTSDLLFSPVSQ